MPVPVVILAAGRGRRLAPLSDEWPKCLVAVGGTSPLDSTLSALATAPGVAEVVLVVGHARERVEAFLAERRSEVAVRSIFNPQYDTQNNIVSAGFARDAGAGGFVLVNSDVICAPALLHEALRGATGNLLVVDQTRPIRAEAMKVRYQAGRLAEIGKHLAPEAADGEYIGIARFDAPGAAAFFRAVDAIVTRGGGGEWYEAAIGEAAGEVPFDLQSTGGRPWIEIDDPADLRRAEREILPRIRRGGGGD